MDLICSFLLKCCTVLSHFYNPIRCGWCWISVYINRLFLDSYFTVTKPREYRVCPCLCLARRGFRLRQAHWHGEVLGPRSALWDSAQIQWVVVYLWSAFIILHCTLWTSCFMLCIHNIRLIINGLVYSKCEPMCLLTCRVLFVPSQLWCSP